MDNKRKNNKDKYISNFIGNPIYDAIMTRIRLIKSPPTMWWRLIVLVLSIFVIIIIIL